MALVSLLPRVVPELVTGATNVSYLRSWTFVRVRLFRHFLLACFIFFPSPSSSAVSSNCILAVRSTFSVLPTPCLTLGMAVWQWIAAICYLTSTSSFFRGDHRIEESFLSSGWAVWIRRGHGHDRDLSAWRGGRFDWEVPEDQEPSVSGPPVSHSQAQWRATVSWSSCRLALIWVHKSLKGCIKEQDAS